MIRQDTLEITPFLAEAPDGAQCVLLVEDDPALRRYLEVVLERAGYAVVSAGDGLGQAALFIVGFSAVFVVLGVSAGLLGRYLFRADEARVVAGAVVIVIGLLTAFSSVLDRWRLGLDPAVLPASRSARSLGLGALVAVGWTPYIGPVLGTILNMGASSQQAGAAAILLVAYSAGLGVPFLAAALALPRVRPVLDALRRHARAVQVVSGAFIVGVGVLILINAFSVMAGWFTFFI